MDTETNDAKQGEEQGTRPREKWMSCGPSGPAAAGCCGTDAGKMVEGWPCGTVFKRHRFTIFAALTGVALTLLIGFAGFILGIIAFFRTF